MRLLTFGVALLLLSACGATPAVTPQRIDVTPEPTPTSPPSAVASASPTATATHQASPTPTATPARVELEGTITFLGEQAGTIDYSAEGCAGTGPYAAIQEGAELVFTDAATDRLLGETVLGESQPSPDVGFTCRFPWSLTALSADRYRIVLADGAVYWELPVRPGEPERLTIAASALAPLPSEEPEDELETYAELFERSVRRTLDIHIKGIEEIEVTEERVLIWVESRYSTEGVMKDLMYELYDEIAGLTPDDWDPDVVIRMGSETTNGYLQSRTSAGDWWEIDDQLDWERATEFTRKGRLCC